MSQTAGRARSAIHAPHQGLGRWLYERNQRSAISYPNC